MSSDQDCYCNGPNRCLDRTPFVTGNRYVIMKWEDAASLEKATSGGLKAWIKKNVPDAREVVSESVQ